LFLDRDSDNDGLSDTLESQGFDADADRDSVLDGFMDNSGDGLDDGVAVFSVNADC